MTCDFQRVALFDIQYDQHIHAFVIATFETSLMLKMSAHATLKLYLF